MPLCKHPWAVLFLHLFFTDYIQLSLVYKIPVRSIVVVVQLVKSEPDVSLVSARMASMALFVHLTLLCSTFWHSFLKLYKQKNTWLQSASLHGLHSNGPRHLCRAGDSPWPLLITVHFLCFVHDRAVLMEFNSLTKATVPVLLPGCLHR